MTDLIAKMEAFRSRLNPMKPYEEEHYITLTEAIVALRSTEATMPEGKHCACKFSSGGVPNQLCQWHLLFIEQQIAKSKEATVRECAAAILARFGLAGEKPTKESLGFGADAFPGKVRGG